MTDGLSQWRPASQSVNTPRTFVQSFIYLSPVQIYIGRVFWGIAHRLRGVSGAHGPCKLFIPRPLVHLTMFKKLNTERTARADPNRSVCGEIFEEWNFSEFDGTIKHYPFSLLIFIFRRVAWRIWVAFCSRGTPPESLSLLPTLSGPLSFATSHREYQMS